jgi:hypothetical protein
MRWEKTTDQERKQVGAELAAARKKKLTPKQRTEIARKAAEGRWGKKRGENANEP